MVWVRLYIVIKQWELEWNVIANNYIIMYMLDLYVIPNSDVFEIDIIFVWDKFI